MHHVRATPYADKEHNGSRAAQARHVAGPTPRARASRRSSRVKLYSLQQEANPGAARLFLLALKCARTCADVVGGVMSNTRCWLALGLISLCAAPAMAQSFRVQCPTSTITHPTAANNNSEPAYAGPTQYTCTVANGCGGTAGNVGYLIPVSGAANGAIKCQQISGGDGYATMADGTQTFLFSFGPLSGLADIAASKTDGSLNANAGTEFPSVFNTVYPGVIAPGDPATTDGASSGGTGTYTQGSGGTASPGFTYNGAVGLVPDADCIAGNAAATAAGTPLPCPNLPPGGLSGHVDPRQ